MPTLIEEIALGKKALDVALKGVRAWKAFSDEPDSLGRLLVLLHADYGRPCDLGRDVFYSWRRRDELRGALEGVLAGELVGRAQDVARLAALVEPRLVRTRDDARRRELAEQIAQAAFTAAPLVVEGGGEATRLVIGHVQAVGDGSRSAATGPAGRVRFNVPDVAASFAGREDELVKLHEALAGDDRAVVTQAISGLGGVGKSQLAARYVHEHAGEYELVAWVGAEEGGVVDLASLAVRLGVPVDGVSPSDRAQAALDWLGASERRWLLVLDNVTSAEQLALLLPRGANGRVLVTSRDRSLVQFGPVLIVDVLDEETATGYLVDRSGRPHDAAGAREVARALGCLPLALAHAAAFCRNGTSFGEYLDLLTALPARELFDTHPEVFYAQTVAATWKPSIEAATRDASLAGEMLELAAHLAPDAIPKSLFEVLVEGDDARARRRRAAAFNALARFSLATVDDTTIGVHRLLQKVVHDDATQGGDDSAGRRALDALDHAFPDDVSLPELWPACERLIAHALTLADTLPEPGAAGPRLIALLNRACFYLSWAEGGRRALAASQTALGHAERLLGSKHPETLTTRSRFALATRQAGDTARAIALFEALLTDQEPVFGTEHASTLRSRHDLAAAYRAAGRSDEAIAIYEPLLITRERVLGTEHPDTLTTRHNLALTYQDAGRTDDAIAIYEPLLATEERVLGTEHPTTLATRHGLAFVYQAAGRTDDAIAIYEPVLITYARVLGTEHPSTLATRHNLAFAYQDAGRTDDAIAIYEPLLITRARVLGPEHPDTLTTRNNLAFAYRAAGRSDEAIAIYEPLLITFKRVLGTEHPDTLVTRHNLAAAYRAAGRGNDATLLDRHA